MENIASSGKFLKKANLLKMPTTNCCSGYHHTKSEKEEIRKKMIEGRAVKKPSISVHTFPVKNEELFKKWKAALSFMDLTSIKKVSKVGVCQLHFLEIDYKQSRTVLKGEVRKRRDLCRDSMPSVFPNVPKYLIRSFPMQRKTQRAAPSMRQNKLKSKADR